GPADYSVTVRVTDNGTPTLDAHETLTIHVGEVNQAPVLASIGDKSVNEGSALTFTASATDADVPANALSYSLDAGAPAGAVIDANRGAFPSRRSSDLGPADYSVTVRVTDNGRPALDAHETFTIHVAEVNSAPVLASIGDKSV